MKDLQDQLTITHKRYMDAQLDITAETAKEVARITRRTAVIVVFIIIIGIGIIAAL